MATDTWANGGNSTRLLTKQDDAWTNKEPRAEMTSCRRLHTWPDSLLWYLTQQRPSSHHIAQSEVTGATFLHKPRGVPWHQGGPGSAAVLGELVWFHPDGETGRAQRTPLATASRRRWRQSCQRLLLGAPRSCPAPGCHPSHRTAPCPGGKKARKAPDKRARIVTFWVNILCIKSLTKKASACPPNTFIWELRWETETNELLQRHSWSRLSLIQLYYD